MSKFINKVVTGVSTLALAASMLVMPFATTSVHAAMAGEVYKTTDGTVWFITDGMQKRPFTSAGAFLSYGFLSFSQVKEADATVTALPTGSFIAPQDGRIFCATETKASDVKGECSLITGGKKAAFTSSAVFTGQGYSFARAYYGDSSFLEKTSNVDNASAQHRPGTLINNNGTIQLVVTGGLWGTPSMDVFNSWGWNIADVVPANSADVLLSQTGVISARTAGQLSPSATTTPGSGSSVACTNDGTEGSIDTTTSASPEETEALEGESDVEIYAIEAELNDDGDLCLDRVDVWFAQDQTITADNDPWTYFEEVSLLVNGEVVETMDANSSSDWSEDSDGEISDVQTTNEYRMRFSGLDAGMESGETTTISVAVTMVDTIDTGDQDAVWWVEIDDDAGLRVTDGTGFTSTEGLSSTTTLEDSFTTGGMEEAVIDLSVSNDSPDASVIEISETADTNDVHIGTFNVEETNGVDVNINKITVDIAIVDPAGGVDPAGAGTVVKTASLVVDGDVIGTETVAATADSVTVTFDNLDWDLDGDDNADVEVQVDIDDTNSAARFDNGTTVQAAAFAITELEDANGNDESDIITITTPGAADAHEVRTEGVNIEFDSSTTSATKTFTADEATEVDQGTFVIGFSVTAFGADMHIDRTLDVTGADCAAEVNVAGQGTEYCFDTSTAAVMAAGSGILESPTSEGASDTTDTFLVKEGETRDFTLTLVTEPDVDGQVQMRIESINYGTATGDTNANYYSFDMSDYKTPYLFLNVY